MSLRVALSCDLRKDYLAMGLSEEDVAEFDTEETISCLQNAIRSLGYRVTRIGNGRELCRRLAAGERWDLVFNVAEGLHGRSREAQVPAVLELFGIPYTFSDPLACAVTLDKAVAKRLVRAAGIRTPACAVVARPADVRGVRLAFPLFVKPVAEGTGKGIDGRSMVRTRAALCEVCGRLLRRFRSPVLVEEYLPGREFTVGILGTGRDARAIGTMEIEIRPQARTGSTYSLETKEKCERLVRYSRLPPGRLRRRIEALALDAYAALECRDAGRVDVRLDALRRPHFLELNPLPGLHPTHSDLPMIATQEGMTYRQLIGAIIRNALSRSKR